MPFNALITQVALDIRTLLLVVLIVLDVAAGVLAAWRSGTFQWERLADWLRRDVAYLIGYFVWYVLTAASLGGTDLQGVSIGDGLGLFGWASAVASLIASIINNLKEAQVAQAGAT